MKDAAITMYQYHAWANNTLLQHVKGLPDSVYREQITSSFPTLAHAFAHILAVDYSWLGIMEGTEMADSMIEGRAVEAAARELSLPELEERYAEVRHRFEAFLTGQADLDRTILVRNPYAGDRDTRLSEIVLQIVNHATYHRGNISTMLRQMGYASTMTEYALFWYADPAQVQA
ncbi:DinB family protein [Paenibacillus kobensis]|uniref:DinB family protein n=1 Tax=Paenibacillus kobensis TaxID=59841 RepID=UPI000FDB4F5E|nr:DinB family protein [Paenibacillus kobensis]